MDNMEKYSVEKAQEEAQILREKVESGKASSYREAEDQAEGERPVTEEMLKTKIIDLGSIDEYRNTPLLYREQLAGLVEKPLLSACEELYDKNIITSETSANKQDVEVPDWENPGQTKPGGGARIVIDFDTLSAKNQEIGRSLGGVSSSNEGTKLTIIIPLTKESTFEEVQTQAEEIAHKFIKQAYRVVTYTLEQMRELNGLDPHDESAQPEEFGDDYYWSPEDKLFFLSKEQYDKAMEQVDEDEKS